jgi:hypothetical protein
VELEMGHASADMVERLYGKVRCTAKQLHAISLLPRAGDRIRTGDVQLGKLAFYP